MREIAKLMKLTISEFDAKKDEIAERVTKLCDKHPLY